MRQRRNYFFIVLTFCMVLPYWAQSKIVAKTSSVIPHNVSKKNTFESSRNSVVDISGNLIVKDQNQFFIRLSHHKVYELVAFNQDTLSTLKKLNTEDLIYCTGLIDEEKQQVLLKSIDYVGLIQLLGSWSNSTQKIEFFNFSHARFSFRRIAQLFDSLNPTTLLIVPSYESVKLVYNVAPTDTSDWILFLSSHQKTNIASMSLEKSKVVFKVIDSNTGDIKTTTTLIKDKH